MKAFKVLISLMLCAAMMLGMACAGAEVLADTGLTLRNVVFTFNGQKIALPQEVRLNLAVEDTGAKIHFELGSGEGVFLPISGEVNADGARFSLGSSGRVYSLALSDAMGAAGLETDESIPAATDMIDNYVSALEGLVNVQKDPEKMAKLKAASDAAMTAMVGSAGKDITVSIDGQDYPAKQYAGSMSAVSALKGTDALFNTGVEEVDAYLQLMLDMMNLSLGTQCTSFTDLFTAMGEDLESEELNAEIVEMDAIIGGDDAVSYEKVSMAAAPEEGISIQVVAEETLTPEKMDMSMRMAGGDETAPVDAQFSLHADLAEGAPTAFEGGLSFVAGYDESDGEYLDSESTTLNAELHGTKENGLWSGDLAVTYAMEEIWGEAADPTSYSDAFGFVGSYAENAEADGSITSTVDLGLDYDGTSFGLKFDLNVAKGSGLENLFAEGSREYALGEDTDEMVSTLLEGDAASLYTDVMELSMDESIRTLMEILGYGAYEAYDDYDYSTDSADEIAVETSYVSVYSPEEISTVFTGEVPVFTPPEGYAFSYADVSSTDFYCEYLSEDSYIDLYVMDFGMDLSEMGDGVTYYSDDDGLVYSADLYSDTYYVSFYMNSVDQATAEAIVAGLEI